jgi:HEPN domain-containing protein
MPDYGGLVMPPHRSAAMAADAFLKVALQYFNNLDKDIIKAGKQMFNDLGGMICAATNLSLAIELYIKALYLVQGNHTHGHDLLDLYHGIPDDLRQTISDNYKKTCEEADSNCNKSVIIGKKKTHSKLTDKGYPNKDDVGDLKDIETVLSLCRNMYITWRYMHEDNKDDNLKLFVFPYGAMHNIGDVLRFHIFSIEEQIIEIRKTSKNKQREC